MEQLLKILQEVKPGAVFENVDDLVEEGILDSLTIVELISVLEDEYEIEVTMEEFVPENFKTVDTILDMIDRLK